MGYQIRHGKSNLLPAENQSRSTVRSFPIIEVAGERIGKSRGRSPLVLAATSTFATRFSISNATRKRSPWKFRRNWLRSKTAHPFFSVGRPLRRISNCTVRTMSRTLGSLSPRFSKSQDWMQMDISWETVHHFREFSFGWLLNSADLANHLGTTFSSSFNRRRRRVKRRDALNSHLRAFRQLRSLRKSMLPANPPASR
jgi:hypothetical protein